MLHGMVSAIRHGGPDGSGYHIEPGLRLRHDRQMIIDPMGGAQAARNEKSIPTSLTITARNGTR
jgi:asparagine synthase (glutamine-hydrolysing)